MVDTSFNRFWPIKGWGKICENVKQQEIKEYVVVSCNFL